MKLILFLFFLILFHNNTKAQVVVKDSLNTEKITVKTIYGTLFFTKTCLDSYSFFESVKGNIKNIDEEVDIEASRKNIKEDKAIINLITNPDGLIVSYHIVKKAKLNSFNLYAEKICKEVIYQLKTSNYKSKLNCKSGNTTSIQFPLFVKFD